MSICTRCNEAIIWADNQRHEFELSYTAGGDYSNGGGEGWGVEHLCKECLDVLKNLLINNGFKLYEIDY